MFSDVARHDEGIIKIRGMISEEKYNELEALLEADRIAVLEDVNNLSDKAVKHRLNASKLAEINMIESCLANVADANTKQTLECILNYLKLLE
jgi:hypothetical protein